MLANLKITEYLEKAAAGTAVPGGGSVAALNACLAAGLIEMVANLTIGKKNYAAVEEEMKDISDEFYVATDDGSKGFRGLGFLDELLKSGQYQRVVVMGSVITMKTVSELTKPYNIPTLVTLTPIMMDGMGMCGVCRVTISGETKFACIDGPEFDAHKVDFDELMLRLQAYCEDEQSCYNDYCTIRDSK